MLRVEDTALVLLAAGRSTRFGGSASKLDQELLGRPLGEHVAVALRSLPFRARIAVVGSTRIDYARHGFRVVVNDDPARGLASSVGLGVALAEEQDAQAVLIALADMPRVTAAHVGRLFDASGGGDTIVASSDGAHAKPPALFGKERFATLKTLSGDAGARDMVRAGRHVVTAPGELVDIDTPEALAQLRTLVG